MNGTLAGVRHDLIRSAREAGDSERMRLAEQLDYLLLEALTERQGYALLAMGHSTEKGCFCPANTLLRGAMDLIAEPFAAVLIDAEAGLEQIQRQVTRRVSRIVVLTDGSLRSPPDPLMHPGDGRQRPALRGGQPRRQRQRQVAAP